MSSSINDFISLSSLFQQSLSMGNPCVLPSLEQLDQTLFTANAKPVPMTNIIGQIEQRLVKQAAWLYLAGLSRAFEKFPELSGWRWTSRIELAQCIEPVFSSDAQESAGFKNTIKQVETYLRQLRVHIGKSGNIERSIFYIRDRLFPVHASDGTRLWGRDRFFPIADGPAFSEDERVFSQKLFEERVKWEQQRMLATVPAFEEKEASSGNKPRL